MNVWNIQVDTFENIYIKNPAMKSENCADELQYFKFTYYLAYAEWQTQIITLLGEYKQVVIEDDNCYLVFILEKWRATRDWSDGKLVLIHMHLKNCCDWQFKPNLNPSGGRVWCIVYVYVWSLSVTEVY